MHARAFLCATAAVCTSLSASLASNPHVIVLPEMEGLLLTTSRDGNVLISSALGLLMSGGSPTGVLPFAPVNVWHRSTGDITLLDRAWTSIVLCTDSHGSMIGGTDYGFGLGTPMGAVVWSPALGADAPRYLSTPGALQSARGDAITWLNRDGSLGLGSTGSARLVRWIGPAGDSPIAEFLLRDGSTATAATPGSDIILCLDPVASDDGRLVAGSNLDTDPFLWRASPGGGCTPLPIQAGWQWTSMRTMSPDGRTIIGTAFGNGNTQLFVVRWAVNPADGAATAAVIAGPYPPYANASGHFFRSLYGLAAGMSDDGAVIGFNATTQQTITPMLWLASGTLGTPSPSGIGRIVPLVDYLAAHGVVMSGVDASVDGLLRPMELISVSADGRTFSGHGIITRIDSFSGEQYTTQVIWTIRVPAKCGLADVAGLGAAPGWDGQLTADDLVLFLDRWFAGDPTVADLASLGGGPAPDGQLTADDLIAFLTAFFAGCP